jgi:DNA polymerase-3 subunit delta'
MNQLADLREIPYPWQQASWHALAERMARGRLPHALLITGPAGLGKRRFAAAFAQLTLCRTPVDGHACGSCAACVQFAAGTHPDYSLVTPEEDKASIGVEQIRDLTAALQLRSQHGGRKLALIEPADAMSAGAANGLLKTLEEPPGDALLLLVSARPGRLPATVRSRCQTLALSPPSAQVSLAWLNGREARQDWPVLLGQGGGAPFAAMALGASGLPARRAEFFEGLAGLRQGRGNPVKLAEHDRESYPELLNLLWSFTADLIRLRSVGASVQVVNRDQLPLLQKAAEGLNLRGLYGFLDRVQTSIRMLDTPLNRELAFTLLLTDWANGLEELKHAPLAARTTWGST